MDKIYDAVPVSAYAVVDMNSAVAVEATATAASAPPTYTMAMDRLDDIERPSAANFPKETGAGPRTDQEGAVTWFRNNKAWMKKYPMHFAAMTGDVIEVFRLASQASHPKDVNQSMGKDWYASTPVQWAASFNQVHVVKALVALGADTQYRNAAKNRALDDAIRENSTHTMKFLASIDPAIDTDPVQHMDRGLHANGGPRPDQFCGQAICTVCCVGTGSVVCCPQHFFSMWGCTPCLDAVLTMSACIPCWRPTVGVPQWFNSQAAGWAASFGQLQSVMALVKASGGAELNRKNAADESPLTDSVREKAHHVTDWIHTYNVLKIAGKL
eukprot:GSChrysophyteH2.ASY1.ANO1.51.1 assembled CDS